MMTPVWPTVTYFKVFRPEEPRKIPVQISNCEMGFDRGFSRIKIKYVDAILSRWAVTNVLFLNKYRKCVCLDSVFDTYFCVCLYIAPEEAYLLSVSYSCIRKTLIYEDDSFIRNGKQKRSAFYLLEMEVKFCNFPAFWFHTPALPHLLPCSSGWFCRVEVTFLQSVARHRLPLFSYSYWKMEILVRVKAWGDDVNFNFWLVGKEVRWLVPHLMGREVEGYTEKYGLYPPVLA
jgi:hypothetical protein